VTVFDRLQLVCWLAHDWRTSWARPSESGRMNIVVLARPAVPPAGGLTGRPPL
jgi:hypothetical protein